MLALASCTTPVQSSSLAAEPVDIQTNLLPGTSAPSNTPLTTATLNSTATQFPEKKTITPSLWPTKAATLSITASEPVKAILIGHFLLARPIVSPGNSRIESSYRYGSSQNGARELHHGVEMENVLGTPVLAAGDGTVVIAGNDQATAYGPKLDFYGQLVIIKHEFPGFDQPVYTLYGHLSEITVQVGQIVNAGQEIGLVGMTGWAIGYHLHFEVRQGENSYENTRNPELWLQPLPDTQNQPTGVLAGRIVNLKGEPLRVARVVLLPVNDPKPYQRIFVETYDDQPMERTDLTIQDRPEDYVLVPYRDQSLGRDNQWQEDFAISDLPAGPYQLSFTVKQVYTLEIEIRPGKLTFVTFPLPLE